MNITMSQDHRYTVDGVPCDSVTSILKAVAPQWMASDWHLQRGTAVHACAAFIGGGVEFTLPPEDEAVIAGQIAACRAWYRDFAPTRRIIEERVASPELRLAGTPDLLCDIDGRPVVVDWKASYHPSVRWQLGAYYALAICTHGAEWPWGLCVVLGDDGKYRIETGRNGKPAFFDLVTAWREYQMHLASYRLLQKEGLK